MGQRREEETSFRNVDLDVEAPYDLVPFVEALGELWDGATKRDFNIGVRGGTQPHAFEIVLLPQTLAAVASLGARVVVTVYAVDFKYLEGQQRRRTRR